MPTNVSTPIWRCDVCGHRFGDHRDAAERCEAGPVSAELAAGTPMLAVRNGRFMLLPLAPTSRLETAASEYNDKSGHSRVYTLGDRNDISDSRLVPGTPGFLQVPMERFGHLRVDAVVSGGLPFADLLRAVGLGQPNSPATTPGVNFGREYPQFDPRWVGPITTPVRAVMDMLGAYPSRTARFGDWYKNQARERYVARVGGSEAAARMLLACSDPAALDAAITNLQDRWLAGEQVWAPPMELNAGRNMTPSKLTKDQKAVVAATGVTWQARTNADEYLNRLMKEALMDDVHNSHALFPGPKIIAIGGVKGGVGKSAVAAALAARLATDGHRTTLVDMDLDGPSQHLLWGLGPVRVDESLTRLLPSETPVANLRVFSSGQVGGALPVAWNEASSKDWVRFVGTALDVSDDEYLVVDLPAGSGPVLGEFLSRSNALEAACFVAVTTADPLALSDAERALRRERPSKAVLVENLSAATGTTPSGEVVQVRLRGRTGDVAAVADAADVAYGGSLPWSTEADVPAALAASAQIGALVEQVRRLAA